MYATQHTVYVRYETQSLSRCVQRSSWPRIKFVSKSPKTMHTVLTHIL